MTNSIQSAFPFNRPHKTGNELEYIKQVLTSSHLSGDGQFTKRVEGLISEAVGGGSSHLTHSCTAALEMAAILSEVGPGDEVILPSYTFVSTANAFVLRGATPVFVDIDPETLNIDPNAVEEAVTEQTKAICVVHYAGVPADMDGIAAIAKRHELILIEDAAQAIGSTYGGQPAGSFGEFAAFSFHETKNVISGEGGALVVNDPRYVERALIIREKGTNRSRFLKGLVDKYTWVDIGSSYLPGELTAAFLLAQVELLCDINVKRLELWWRYHEALSIYEGKVRRPIIPANVTHNGHLYYLLLPGADTRAAFIDRMKAKGVSTPFHYIPLHSSPYGQEIGRAVGDLSVTTRVSQTLVRLPLFFGMARDIDYVIEQTIDTLDELI